VIARVTPTSLARWHAAEQSWRTPALQLEKAAAENSGDQRRAQSLYSEIESYITDYGDLIVSIARFSPSAVRSSDAAEEGTIRLDQIASDTDAVARTAAADAADRTAAASRLAHRASVAGIVALVLTPVLLILLGLWLARLVAAPLRRTVDAATSVAAGDFDVRLNEQRRDEFGLLGRAFNAMTASLSASRQELIERAESLEQSERHKSELISMVSHEIRTPLASVLGFSRLLLERELTEEQQKQYLRIIDSEATRLSSLVGDFLDAQLLEEGRFALRIEELDLAGLVVDHAERVVAYGGTHQLAVDVEEPLEIQADRLRLAQVVDNLLSNAVKYAEAGTTVTVGARAASGRARVWVDDQGPGIRDEHRGQLFHPFYRGEAPAAGIPGAGLGLAVSQRIVEAHEGSIGFEPLPRGARFWFELPLRRRELVSA